MEIFRLKVCTAIQLLSIPFHGPPLFHMMSSVAGHNVFLDVVRVSSISLPSHPPILQTVFSAQKCLLPHRFIDILWNRTPSHRSPNCFRVFVRSFILQVSLSPSIYLSPLRVTSLFSVSPRIHRIYISLVTPTMPRMTQMCCGEISFQLRETLITGVHG